MKLENTSATPPLPKGTTLEPITLDESRRLIDLEKIIEAGQQTFVEVGIALAEIRDAGLYKADFDNFDDYCVTKWGFKRSYAYQLIESAGVAVSVSAIADIKTESQARELAKVPQERREIVIKAATAKAESSGRKLTAKDISVVAQPHSAAGVAAVAAVGAPKTESTEDKLRTIWGQATPTERSNFLTWIKTQPADEDPDRFRCDSCDATFADDCEGVSLYECNDCGSRFTRETSANDNHQCPDCSKFGSKVSDCGCPECNEGELQEIACNS